MGKAITTGRTKHMSKSISINGFNDVQTINKGEIMAIRYPPTDDKEIRALANSLVLFVNNPVNKSLNKFAIDNWYTPHRLWKLAERHQYFSDCLEYGRAVIADRMRRAACTREEDSASVFKLLSTVDVEYAQLRREESDRVTRNIDAMRGSGTTVIQVIGEPILNSPLVPVRQVTIDKPGEME